MNHLDAERDCLGNVLPMRGRDGLFRPFLTRVDSTADESGNISRRFFQGSKKRSSMRCQAAAAMRQSIA